ncbi:NTP transferase domain-containing protein [Phenylobacterium immobile]|uniref:NTP transferase domain-containing protein n=1 Tax=Phenylobacterium immobile TaxID=21 RepID=UPI000A40F315|nr:NTP transferase domain-containing protein [Phenylobacterium immobile]
MSRLRAIILAGGRAERMGRDKALIAWDGETAIARIARLADAAGAGDVIVAGGDYGLPFVMDAVAYGGPVGGVLAAAAAPTQAERFLILAVDAPTITLADLGPLLAAPSPGAVYAGFPLPMVIDRRAVPVAMEVNDRLLRLIEAAGLGTLEPPLDVIPRLRGANTPEDLAVLQQADPPARSP